MDHSSTRSIQPVNHVASFVSQVRRRAIGKTWPLAQDRSEPRRIFTSATSATTITCVRRSWSIALPNRSWSQPTKRRARETHERPPRLKRFVCDRSEERRVGKECRSRWLPYDKKKIKYFY